MIDINLDNIENIDIFKYFNIKLDENFPINLSEIKIFEKEKEKEDLDFSIKNQERILNKLEVENNEIHNNINILSEYIKENLESIISNNPDNQDNQKIIEELNNKINSLNIKIENIKIENNRKDAIDKITKITKILKGKELFLSRNVDKYNTLLEKKTTNKNKLESLKKEKENIFKQNNKILKQNIINILISIIQMCIKDSNELIDYLLLIETKYLYFTELKNIVQKNIYTKRTRKIIIESSKKENIKYINNIKPLSDKNLKFQTFKKELQENKDTRIINFTNENNYNKDIKLEDFNNREYIIINNYEGYPNNKLEESSNLTVLQYLIFKYFIYNYNYYSNLLKKEKKKFSLIKKLEQKEYEKKLQKEKDKYKNLLTKKKYYEEKYYNYYYNIVIDNNEFLTYIYILYFFPYSQHNSYNEFNDLSYLLKLIFNDFNSKYLPINQKITNYIKSIQQENKIKGIILPTNNQINTIKDIKSPFTLNFDNNQRTIRKFDKTLLNGLYSIFDYAIYFQYLCIKNYKYIFLEMLCKYFKEENNYMRYRSKFHKINIIIRNVKLFFNDDSKKMNELLKECYVNTNNNNNCNYIISTRNYTDFDPIDFIIEDDEKKVCDILQNFPSINNLSGREIVYNGINIIIPPILFALFNPNIEILKTFVNRIDFNSNLSLGPDNNNIFYYLFNVNQLNVIINKKMEEDEENGEGEENVHKFAIISTLKKGVSDDVFSNIYNNDYSEYYNISFEIFEEYINTYTNESEKENKIEKLKEIFQNLLDYEVENKNKNKYKLLEKLIEYIGYQKNLRDFFMNLGHEKELNNQCLSRKQIEELLKLYKIKHEEHEKQKGGSLHSLNIKLVIQGNETFNNSLTQINGYTKFIPNYPKNRNEYIYNISEKSDLHDLWSKTNHLGTLYIF
jgi:hypothetical protein